MRKASFFTATLLLFIAAAWTAVSTGCANIIPPSGGPRDTLAPRLVSALPKDSTLNFRSNRVTLNFDEYVDLQEVQNNLLFTPTFEVNPEVSVRGKTVTVRFRDSLLPNTTYLLNFGNAIRDMNESNPIRNFIYTFSTGPALDSLTLSGKVTLAENGKTDSMLIVMLHRNLTDSAVVKERPVYVARVDASGNFRFQNLPRDTFAIYALGEAGIVRRYQNKNQYFAFADSAVVPGASRDLTLYAYREQPTKTTTAAPGQTRGAAAADRRLRFTNTSGTLDLQRDFVLTFQTPLRRYDSTQMALSTDSAFTPAPFITLLDTSRTQLSIRSQWREGTPYHLVLGKDFAEDTAGRRLLKSDTLNFSTKKIADYGQLRLRIRNADTARRPVLQFVQSGQVVFSALLPPGGIFTARLFNPGDYELQVLYDANGNGKWDPGHFFGTKRQPEIVVPLKQGINVKAAWDNEFERSL
ncbi:Ig-like domain-containing protein [Flavisolibacter nicotianae]|uniref:Ig-like domain-containing protein n=1 Tax=Flavisolibacter nicotianae TaxID=2364882 RepID=UPI000EB4147B|nr:Ig-like domain-containing protein [Flavisolibacter nicotianae]